MSKTNLNDIGDVRAATSIINNNNALIENAIENTLSRDGTGPNEMNAQLDMNDHRVINLPAPVSDSEPMRKQDIEDLIAAASSGIIATQPEAEAGVDNKKVMSPLRTKQQIDARLASEAEAEAGTDAVKLLTPATGLASVIANAQDGLVSAPGPYAQPRTIEVSLSDFVDVRKYGVSAANTSSQNRQAMQNALDNETKLYFSEMVRVDAPLTITNKVMDLQGRGGHLSGILFEGCNGLNIDMSTITGGVRRPTTIVDLSIQTDSANLYDGLTFTGRTGVVYSKQLQVDRAVFCGSPINSVYRWGRNVVLNQGGQSDFTACSFIGGGNSNRSTAGVFINDTKIVRMIACDYYALDDAVAATNFSEGVTMIDASVLACVNGLVSYNNTGNQFTVLGGHFAVAVSAVILGADRNGTANTGSNHSVIMGTFPLVYDGLPDHVADDFIAFDIGSTDTVVTGNNVLRTTATKARYGARIRAVAGRGVPQNVIVKDNNLSAMTAGVVLDVGVINCLVGPNRGAGMSRASMINDNSGSSSNRFYLADGNGIAQHAPLHEFISRDGTMARVTHTTTGTAIANYLTMYSNIAANPPRIQSEGSDANIDLRLLPKGTGAVRFGTHTANADAPIVGYITVKDDAGTLRKLAVIA